MKRNTFFMESGFMKYKTGIIFGLLLVLGFLGCSTFGNARTGMIYRGADYISKEITSMLWLEQHTDIIAFDGTTVQWLGNNKHEKQSCVVIPSGRHSITARSKDGYRTDTRDVDFQPDRLYRVSIWSESGKLSISDITEDTNTGTSGYTYATTILKEMRSAISYNTNTRPGAQSQGGIQNALNRASQTLIGTLNRQDRIAIINVASSDVDMAQFVAEELEVILVRRNFTIVDRRTLDRLRQEQRFQLSGEVDDNTAVSIGRFAGANVVIVGSISGSGTMRRLRLRALDVQDAHVIESTSEAF